MTKPRTYTPELREEAVKLVLAQGLTLDEAAKRIAIPMGTLATWVKAAKLGNGAVTAPGSRTVPKLEAEVVRLISLVGSPVASRQRGPRRTVRAGFPRIRLEHSVKRHIDVGLARLRKPFASITLSIRLIAETKGAEP